MCSGNWWRCDGLVGPFGTANQPSPRVPACHFPVSGTILLYAVIRLPNCIYQPHLCDNGFAHGHRPANPALVARGENRYEHIKCDRCPGLGQPTLMFSPEGLLQVLIPAGQGLTMIEFRSSPD